MDAAKADKRETGEPAVNKIFQNYIDQLVTVDSFDGLTAVLSEAAAKFGMGKMVYLGFPAVPQGDRPIALTTYPDAWCERYLSEHYQNIDPVIQIASRSAIPFEWGVQDDIRVMSRPQLQIFDEAAEFGIFRGFTIPVHHSAGHAAAVTFVSDEPEAMFRRGLMRNRHLLHLTGIYFHAHVMRLVARSSSEVLSKLTRREFQCLSWASRGKSATDIATILSISRHTAVFHLENAKRKLGVRTAYQAIALLVSANNANSLAGFFSENPHDYGGCRLSF